VDGVGAAPARGGLVTRATQARDARDVQEAIRDASERGAALRIAGAGTWLDGGRPVDAAEQLSLGGWRGIVEYVPGDLTLTAHAGTPLDDLARATGAENQWLTLDPIGAPSGTIGATVATASAGPLAHAFGTPRDAVLGLETVTGGGVLVRSGGRVVKNVAGFDLTRLFTGSWGTLGVITQVTVRLRPRPEVDETVALAVSDEATGMGALLDRLRCAPVAPLAAEIVSAALAARLGLERRTSLLLRLGGNAASVRAQRAGVAALGDSVSVPTAVWPALVTRDEGGAAVIRLSSRPSRLSELWVAAARAAQAHGAADGAFAHASVGRGIVRCLAEAQPVEALERWLHALVTADATRIIEKLPIAMWVAPPMPTPSPVGGRISRALKDAFDPSGILNPGIHGAPA